MIPTKGKRSKLINLIISFILALLLWSILNMDSNSIISRTIFNVPVTIINEDVLSNNSLTIDKDIEYYVNLEIRGTEENIDSINPENLSAELDVSKITEPGTYDLDVVVKGLNNTVILEDTIPKTIQITVDYITNENIVPEILTQGLPLEGYNVISAYTTETVTLSGPNNILEKVNSVSGTVSVNGFSEDTREFVEVFAYDINGNKLNEVTCSPSVVLATLNIGVTKEVPVSPPEISGTAAEGFKVTKVTVNPEQVLIAGNPDLIEEIEKITLKSIEIPGNENNKTFTVETQMVLPNGITVLNNSTNVLVTVNIEQIIEKTYTISTLDPNGLADDLEITRISPGSVTLKVRGTASELESINASTLKGIINCSNLSAGNYQLNVTFDLPEITIVSIEPETVDVEIQEK